MKLVKDIATMTVKFALIILAVTAVVSCIFISPTDMNASKDLIQKWAVILGTTEHDMREYLVAATGIHERELLLHKLADKSPSWSVFYNAHDFEFDALIRQYEGTEMERNIKARSALYRIGKHMSELKQTYLENERDILAFGVYSGMLKELNDVAYLRLEKIALREPISPFLHNDDAELWELIRHFIAKFEHETRNWSDLSEAFHNIRFDRPLMVVHRLRNQPIVYDLLTDHPTHQALGKLFKAMESELPRLL